MMRLAVVVLVGCGGPHAAGTPDAPASDGPSVVTAPLHVVTNTHLAGGVDNTPAARVDVVALRTDGSVSDLQQSDDAGKATVGVSSGGSVTAIYKHVADKGADLVTFLGVEPGQSLTFGRRISSGTGFPLGAINVSWPLVADSDGFEVFTPCGNALFPSDHASGTVEATSQCDVEPFEASFIALDAAGQLGKFGFTSVPQFQPGGTLAIDAWTDPKPLTATFTGLPDEITNLQLQVTEIGTGAAQLFTTGVGGVASGHAFTQTIGWAPVGTRTFAQLFVQRNGGAYPSSTVNDSLPPFASLWTVTPDTKYPPYLAGQLVVGPARMVVFFPVSTMQADTFDAAVTQMVWTHEVVEGTTMTFSTFSWTVISPPEITAYNLPALPAAFEGLMPSQDDFTAGNIRLIEIPTVNDYTALEAIGERDLVCPECAVREGIYPRILTNN